MNRCGAESDWIVGFAWPDADTRASTIASAKTTAPPPQRATFAVSARERAAATRDGPAAAAAPTLELTRG